MTTGIRIRDAWNVSIYDTYLSDLTVGLDVGGRSYVKLKNLKIGSTKVPLIIRDYSTVEIYGGVILDDRL